jgi:hypothetical protein
MRAALMPWRDGDATVGSERGNWRLLSILGGTLGCHAASHSPLKQTSVPFPPSQQQCQSARDCAAARKEARKYSVCLPFGAQLRAHSVRCNCWFVVCCSPASCRPPRPRTSTNPPAPAPALVPAALVAVFG